MTSRSFAKDDLLVAQLKTAKKRVKNHCLIWGSLRLSVRHSKQNQCWGVRLVSVHRLSVQSRSFGWSDFNLQSFWTNSPPLNIHDPPGVVTHWRKALQLVTALLFWVTFCSGQTGSSDRRSSGFFPVRLSFDAVNRGLSHLRFFYYHEIKKL